jgi:hypothetical protein
MTVLERKARFIKSILDDEVDETILNDLEMLYQRLLRREPCLFSEEELIQRAIKAERDFELGKGIPHEEMKKKHVV